jgi:O-antigen/teichoic acid export membrane protein
MASTDASEKTLVSSSAILSAAQLVAAAIGFVTTLVAARWLGSEAFGLAAVVMAYPAVIYSVANIKTGAVTQRYVSGFRATRQGEELLAACKLGFSIDLVIAAVVAVVVTALILMVGDLPGTQGNAWLLVLFAISFPFASFVSTSIVVLFSFERTGLLATLQVMQKLLTLAAVLTALLIRRDTAAFVVGTAVGQAVGGLIYLAVASAVLHEGTNRPWWRASLSVLRDVRGELRGLFAWNFLGSAISGAMVQVPILLLGASRSPTEAGYFRLASAIAVTADAVEAAMSRVAYTTLAAAQAEADIQRIARLIVAWSKREARIGFACGCVAMLLLPLLVFGLLGHEYHGMVYGTEMLLVGTAVSTAFFFVTPYLYSAGMVKRWVVAYGLYALLALGVSAIVVNSAGFFGVAIVIGFGLALLNGGLGVPILREAKRTSEQQSLFLSTPGASAGARQ